MDEQILTAETRRTLPGPPALVWALLADSNRWDRAFGFRPSTVFKPSAILCNPAASPNPTCDPG